MKNLKTNLLVIGTKMSAFAIIVAELLAPTCRHAWYQPKEPENLRDLLKK